MQKYKEALGFIIIVLFAVTPCVVLSGDERAGLDKEALSEDGSEAAYFKLSFGDLVEDRPLEALKRLENVEDKAPEVLAVRCFAAFQLDSWEEVIDYFDKLEKPYKSLDGYHGIAIESLTSLGEVERAEELLENLLRSPPEPSSGQFPSYFQAFKKEKLDHWNRNFVAALFYKIVKKDYQKSLKYFDKIAYPTPLAQVEKAGVLSQIGQVNQARNLLLGVLSAVKGTAQEKEIGLRLLPLLASVTAKIGFYPEVLPYYREYFTLPGAEDEFRIPYAQALMHVKRYDLALEQFIALMKSRPLSHEEMLSYIESLVRTNQFDEANSVSRNWLYERKVPLIYQIKLARLMIVTQDKELIESIFLAIKEKDVRTLEENQQLILLWLDLGDYDQARTLADVLHRSLEQSLEGLVVLIKLNARLSRYEEALTYTEMAAQLSPWDQRVLDFYETYEREAPMIARSAKFIKERLEFDPDSITLQIHYAKDMIDLGVETYAELGVGEIGESQELGVARSTLEGLVKRTQEIPEIYFLLGKVDYLLDKEKESKEAYEKAIALDVSYAAAYQHLALIYEGYQELKKAVGLVKNAVKFDPTNSRAWLQLGGLLKKEKDFRQAIEAFNQARKYNPNGAEPYKRLAEIYLELGNPEFAIAYSEKVLELYPKDIEAVKMMLLSLHDEKYISQSKDPGELKKRQTRFFDKLQALDFDEAQAMRAKLGVPAE